VLSLTRPADRGSRELEARLTAIEARLLAVEARFGVRDQADRDLLMAVREACQGLPFTVRAVWARRGRDAAFRSALEAADVDSPKQLGKWLARLAGVDVDGLTVTRKKGSRAGMVWQIVGAGVIGA
jgi:hypothetical protein